VHFVDFLRATVLLSAAAATALVLVTVLAVAPSADPTVIPISVGWWVLAAAIGLRLGRHAEVNPPIARLLAEARSSTALPEYRPGATLLNRLWPLLLFTLLAGGLAFLLPQIPGIGAGFAIALALWWRRQDAAVAAIEERDGVRFHVLRTSPFRSIALARTPGFKTLRPQRIDGATT
jgi:4-amino-4-deoxy-L-arabinose transferase-like glycosyltransferase